jgi:hypothetical protein
MNPTVTLTQQQAQYLLSRLSMVAHEEQKYRSAQKKTARAVWNFADKDKPNGAEAFAILNQLRDDIRASRREEARINAVIRQLRTVNV